MANMAYLPIAVRASRVPALLDCSSHDVDDLVELGALRTVRLSGATELRVPLSDSYAALGLQPPTEVRETCLWDCRCKACPVVGMAEGPAACPPMDLVALAAEIRAERRGQRNALIIALASLLASVVLGLAGETVVASSLGGSTIVALSRVFVAGRYSPGHPATE